MLTRGGGAIVTGMLLYVAATLLTYRVTIAPPRFTLLQSGIRGELRETCGYDTAGCTKIRGQRVNVDCVQDGDRWRAALDISFVPYVFIGEWSRRDRVVAHERAHLMDLHDAAERFARDAAERRYLSADRCSADAQRLHASLHLALESAAVESVKSRR